MARRIVAIALTFASTLLASSTAFVEPRPLRSLSDGKVSKMTRKAAGKNVGRRSLLQQATDFLPLLPGVWFVYLFSRLPKSFG
eukprot:symbB.v1.2.013526.t1/scaffold795.1/size259473/18